MGFFNIFKKTITEEGNGVVFDTFNSFWGKKANDDKPDVGLMTQYKSAYLNFPIITSQIEQVVIHTIQDFYFEGPTKEKLMKFKDKNNLSVFLEEVERLEQIYGFVPVEVVKQTSKEFPLLKILPSKNFIIYRSQTGEDIGFSLLKVLWGTTGDKSKDKKFTTKVSIDNIVIFRRVVLGLNDKYGTSRIHSMLTALRQKEQNEANIAVALERYANPIIDISVGNESFSPSENDITSIKNSLENLRNDSEFVHSWLVKPSVLGFEGKGMDTEPILANINQQILTGGLVPSVLLNILDVGDKGAEIQLRAFGRLVKSEQRSLALQFEDKIIQKLKLGTEEDKLIWGKVEERESQMDFDIVVALKNAGIVSPQKANDLLPPKFKEVLSEELANPQKAMMESQETKIGKADTDPTKRDGNPKSMQSVKVDDKDGQKANQPKVKKEGVPK